jgi:methyl-accepting chemotaxis protein WspA
MKNWTIRQRIIGSFAVILGLMAVMAGGAFVRITAIAKDATTIQQDALPGLYYILRIDANWHEHDMLLQRLAEIDVTEAGLKGDRERLKSNAEALNQLLRQYEPTISTDDDRAVFNAFKASRAEYDRRLTEFLKLDLSKKTAAVHAVYGEQLVPAWTKIEAMIEDLAKLNKAAGDTLSSEIAKSMTRGRTVMLSMLLTLILIAFTFGYFLLRAISEPMQRLLAILELMRSGDFTQRLALDRQDEFGVLAAGFNRMTDELTALVGQAQKSSMQVTTSVTEIAATSRQQQATASETAATTTEIGATAREILATSRDLVHTMNEVSQVSEDAAALAGSGQDSLTRMEETMHNVTEAAGSVNAKLAILSEKAGNINQVVTTITKVADQTNLLSLNAAIEAEKAGEYGRGFAVVATEIRRLADQTAVATYDIELMVKEIQSAVSAGVMGMEKFSDQVRRGMTEVQQVGGQLSQIIHQVQALAPRFQVVNEGMQAQASSAEQINQALAQLSEAAQQTVESLQQSSQAIDELNMVSNGLRNGVSRFKAHAG